MKFGPVPTAEAAGAILAHSVSTPEGRLRKGLTLDAAHIAQLQSAGHDPVIVARLEQGDIGENPAATALGAALLEGTRGVRATVAATGRVNLIAQGAGLVRLDADKLMRLNAVNPMISLATVPHLHQIHDGGMIGTVKIISYAVPEADLAEACTQAAGALDLIAPKRLRASLIVTQIAAGASESKGIEATRARLEALNAELIDTVLVPHRTADLTAALARAEGDLVLILTGSATSDPFDVGPEALRQAGGTLTRFGMPVDPGNLLFLGKIGQRDVLGLPGCARSPALNGTDLVLGRLLCGLEVTSADIAAMGAGGLLKEIPTRPRPRSG